MVSVTLENISKYFGKVRAVENLNLKIEDGEFIALLGPSGCGKTTTLLMIAGIYKPSKGNIYFGDKIVNDLPPRDRNVGMVFQSYALYPHMKVFDNIAFPLKLRKEPKDFIKKKVQEVAELLKIEDLLDRKPSQLSGGQQQRVALGRALAKEPNVFLMDEPLANLDAKLRVIMRVELKRLQKRLGITTIYVTHDQVEAMTMADRIAVLSNGRLQQVGRSEELYNKPRNLFVAGFIGSPPMNFVDCIFVEEGDEAYLEAEAFRLRLTDSIKKVLKENARSSELILGVRPEDIIISERKAEGSFEAEIYAMEPLGRDVIVNLRMNDTILKMMTSSLFKGAVGEKIWVRISLDKIHIFDKKTESAIL